MIRITSIRNAKPKEYDRSYAIVRSMKRGSPGLVQAPELSPSWGLFKNYRKLVEMNQWNHQTFQTIYVPMFIYETCANVQCIRSLDALKAMDSDGLSVELVCFCADESLCHRSIVAGILAGMGCDVHPDGSINDYIKYYDMFKKTMGA